VKYSLWGLPVGLGLAGALIWLNVEPGEPEQAISSSTLDNTESQSGRMQSESLTGRAKLGLAEAKIASQANLMPPGVQSVLAIATPLKHGQFVWNENGVPQGSTQIWVDLRRQTISVFRAGHEIGSAIIVYGADEKQTPLGRFEILSKHRHYRSRSYDAEMPYAMFITTDGIALHSSVLQPRHATHGCVGLPDEFSRRLFEIAQVGATVEIVRSDTKSIERHLAAEPASIH
jgi:hypothetical protein